MVRIRVYNSCGQIRITKTVNDKEQTIFSDLKDGQIADIKIEVANLSVNANKING